MDRPPVALIVSSWVMFAIGVCGLILSIVLEQYFVTVIFGVVMMSSLYMLVRYYLNKDEYQV